MKKSANNTFVVFLLIILLGLSGFGFYYLLWGRTQTPFFPPSIATNVIQVKEEKPSAAPTVTPTPQIDPLVEIQNLNVAPDDADLKELDSDLQNL